MRNKAYSNFVWFSSKKVWTFKETLVLSINYNGYTHLRWHIFRRYTFSQCLFYFSKNLPFNAVKLFSFSLFKFLGLIFAKTLSLWCNKWNKSYPPRYCPVGNLIIDQNSGQKSSWLLFDCVCILPYKSIRFAKAINTENCYGYFWLQVIVNFARSKKKHTSQGPGVFYCRTAKKNVSSLGFSNSDTR